MYKAFLGFGIDNFVETQPSIQAINRGIEAKCIKRVFDKLRNRLLVLTGMKALEAIGVEGSGVDFGGEVVIAASHRGPVVEIASSL